MIRVLICDDQAIVCDGLEAILSTDPQIEVVGIVHDGHEAIEAVGKLQPNLVLMDLKMPLMNGVQATERIRASSPDVRVLVLTTYADDSWVFDAIRSGATGYLLKDAPRGSLLAAVKDAAAGHTPIDPVIGGKLFAHIASKAIPTNSRLFDELNEREREILRMVAHGLSNTDIAEHLHLSSGTVKNYLSSIFVKLGVGDRTQAAVLALRYGLAD
jgi:two-component system, NarL family, response regulator LiaR